MKRGNCLKRKQRAQNGVTRAKSHMSKPRLNIISNLFSVSASPRNVTFNQSIWNYLVSSSEVICLIDPYPPSKESDLPWNHPLFVRIISLPPSPWSSFLFFGRAACGILVPQPGIEPVPPALEAQSLNHWSTREVPGAPFYLLRRATAQFINH